MLSDQGLKDLNRLLSTETSKMIELLLREMREDGGVEDDGSFVEDEGGRVEERIRGSGSVFESCCWDGSDDDGDRDGGGNVDGWRSSVVVVVRGSTWSVRRTEVSLLSSGLRRTSHSWATWVSSWSWRTSSDRWRGSIRKRESWGTSLSESVSLDVGVHSSLFGSFGGELDGLET